MKVLILGSTGLLGSNLTHFLKKKNYQIIKHGYNVNSDINFDLTNIDETIFYFKKINPQIIINLIALTNLDECEYKPKIAYKINAEVVQNITIASKELIDPYLIQLSTDNFYNSNFKSKEKDIQILNTYSKTKFEGEKFAKKMEHICLRTNFFGFSKTKNRKSFSDWILQNLKERRKIQLFKDVIFNPLSMNTLCEIIDLVIKKRIIGSYNVGSLDNISKADFGFFLAEIFNFSSSLFEIISIDDYNFYAKRPKNMSTDCQLFESKLKFKLPYIKDEIVRIKNEVC